MTQLHLGGPGLPQALTTVKTLKSERVEYFKTLDFKIKMISPNKLINHFNGTIGNNFRSDEG